MYGQKQNLRAQAPDPVLVPFLGRCLYFILAFFSSLWFYLLSDDFLAHTALYMCVRARVPSLHISHPLTFFPLLPFAISFLLLSLQRPVT